MLSRSSNGSFRFSASKGSAECGQVKEWTTQGGSVDFSGPFSGPFWHWSRFLPPVLTPCRISAAWLCWPGVLNQTFLKFSTIWPFLHGFGLIRGFPGFAGRVHPISTFSHWRAVFSASVLHFLISTVDMWIAHNLWKLQELCAMQGNCALCSCILCMCKADSNLAQTSQQTPGFN